MRAAKIGIIFGNNDKENDINEGKFVYYGNIYDEEVFHSQCLLDFAQVYFSDKSIFNKLSFRHAPTTIGYFYTLFGHVLLLNTSSAKHGRSLNIMMPNNISDDVRDKLYKVISELEDFSLTILYDLELSEGIIKGSEMSTYSSEDRIKLLDSYFDNKTNNKTK